MLSNDRRAVPLYLVAVFGLSAVFYALSATRGGGEWIDYIGCPMWCPAAAALLTCKYLGRTVNTIAWRWGNTRYEIIGYFVPLGYAAAIYIFACAAGLAKFYNKSFVDLFSKEFGFGPLPGGAAIALYFCFTATLPSSKISPQFLAKRLVGAAFSCLNL